MGLTRAKLQLHPSAARVRSVFGMPQLSEVSRFVDKIPEHLMEVVRPEPAANFGLARSSSYVTAYGDDVFGDTALMPPRRALTECAARVGHGLAHPVPASSTGRERSLGEGGFAPGTRVLHVTFGEGSVTHTEGEGPKQKLTVLFPHLGHEVIVARFVEPLG